MLLNKEIKNIIKEALKEDIGKRDITTLLTIDKKTKVKASIIAKEKGVLCGIDIAGKVFPKGISLKPLRKDGSIFKKNQKIAIIKGNAQKILNHERVALNLISLLSGISTLTKKFVAQTSKTNTKIMDTRKTAPLLRILEKYAVRIGGGHNHRKRLDELILIKDNHLRAGKFVTKGRINESRIKQLFAKLKKKTASKIEIEVENLREFKEIIKHKPTIIMLDNFTFGQLKKAVILRNKYFPKVKLEASGGVNLANVKKIAKTGVDFISVGTITHSAPAIDFSLEVTNQS